MNHYTHMKSLALAASLLAAGCAAGTAEVDSTIDVCSGAECVPDAGANDTPDPFAGSADAETELTNDVGTEPPPDATASADAGEPQSEPDADDAPEPDAGAEPDTTAPDASEEARCDVLDCGAEACFSHPACTQTVETSCVDGLDNDRDGVPDCLDTDCFVTTPECHNDDRWEPADDERASAPTYDDAGARPHRLCPDDSDWIAVDCNAVYRLPFAALYERALYINVQGAEGVAVTARLCGESGAPVEACREVEIGRIDATGRLAFAFNSYDEDGDLIDGMEGLGGLVCAMPGRPVHVELRADYSEAVETRECAVAVVTAGEVPVVDPREEEEVIELAPGEVFPESYFEMAPLDGLLPRGFDVLGLPKIWPNDVDRIRVPIPRGRVCTTVRWTAVALSGSGAIDANLLAEDAVIVEHADGAPLDALRVFDARPSEFVPEHRYVRHCTERNNRARFIELDLAMLNDVALTFDPDSPPTGVQPGAGLGYWVWSTVERDIGRGEPENIAGLDAWEVRSGDETPLVEFPLRPGTWRYLSTGGEFGEYSAEMYETDYLLIETDPGREIRLLATPVEAGLLERGMRREDMELRVREVLATNCDACTAQCVEVRDQFVCAGRVLHESDRVATEADSGASLSFTSDARDGVGTYLVEIGADTDSGAFVPYDFTYIAD